MSVTSYPTPTLNRFGHGETHVWRHVSTWGWHEWQAWLRGAGWDEARIQVYKHERKRYGLGITPLKRGKPDPEAKVQWLYRPTPKQVEFHKCESRFVLYGGAAGGRRATRFAGTCISAVWRSRTIRVCCCGGR